MNTGTPGAGTPSGSPKAPSSLKPSAGFVIKAPTPAPAASSSAPAPSASQGQPGAQGGTPQASPQPAADPRAAAGQDRGDGRDAQGRWVGAGRDPAEGQQSQQAPDPEPAPEPVELPRFKVNGREVEGPAYLRDLLSNPNLKPEVRNALLADMQRGLAADELFRGASERQSAIENLLKQLKGPNRAEAFRQLLGHKEIGLNHVEVAQEILAREFAREQLSPEQRELEDLKSERDRLKQEAEARAAEAQQIRLEQHRAQVQQQLQRDIIGALDNPSISQGLPKTTEVVERVNKYLIRDAQLRAQLDPQDPRRAVPLRAEHVLPLVKQDYQRDLQSFVGTLDAPSLISFLGEDIAKKIREHDLAQLRSAGPRIETPSNPQRPRPQQQAAVPQKPHGVPEGRETYEQARERILARFK